MKDVFNAINRRDINAINEMRLESNIDINEIRENNTPLTLAIRSRKPEIAKLLIEFKGINLNLKIPNDEAGSYIALMVEPIFLCIVHDQPEILEALLDKSVDPNLRFGEYGVTPLMYAALLGKTAFMDILLKRGSDLHLKSSNGCTALDHAAIQGQSAAVMFLLERGEPDASILKAAHYAFKNKHFALAHELRSIVSLRQENQLKHADGTEKVITSSKISQIEKAKKITAPQPPQFNSLQTVFPLKPSARNSSSLEAKIDELSKKVGNCERGIMWIIQTLAGNTNSLPSVQRHVPIPNRGSLQQFPNEIAVLKTQTAAGNKVQLPGIASLLAGHNHPVYAPAGEREKIDEHEKYSDEMDEEEGLLKNIGSSTC